MAVVNPINNQYGKQPFYYTNGLVLRNSVVTPLTLIRVSAGTTIDSTGTYQIGTTDSLSGSLLASGAGGIDSGIVTASSVYGLYLIADTVGVMPPSLLFSFSYGASVNGPLMPYGYNCFSFIGCVTTNSSSEIVPGIWTGNNGSYRTFTYDSPIQVLSAGTSTSYADVELLAAVPLINTTPVNFYSDFNANAAADIQNLTRNSSSGDAVTVIAPVAGSAAHTTSTNTVLSSISVSAQGPAIKYKVSAGSLSLYVTGYDFYV